MFTVVGIMPDGSKRTSQHGSRAGMLLKVEELEQLGCISINVINGANND